MTNLNRLLQEQEQKNTSGKTKISTIALYLGVQARPHFPKIRDANGKKLTDLKTGRDMVSENSDGETYTLSELGSSKVVKIIAPAGIELVVGEAYRIEGLGYDMRSSNMIFVDEDCLIDEIAEV